MAATPPLQITETPRTPPTPLHGATYDHDSPRRTSARLRQKRVFEEALAEPATRPSRSVKTPNSPRAQTFEPKSPDQTPQRKPTARRVQIMSPTSPDSDTFGPKPTRPRLSSDQPLLSTTTIMTEGMLPTPVKTPNKKQKIINKSNIAARALFQDQIAQQEMAPSPRRNRTKKRHNGFSLESFREANEGQNGIQIFTDSRDQVPQLDDDEDNPFVDRDRQGTSSRVVGTSKRRKVSEPRKMDPQVEEALEDDEGMVYVFRGKKVYRRFDDTGEEEESIDEDDLGLLRHTDGGERVTRSLKTLTRKSIKPTRLFQTEAQKRARELQKEEEAMTDIEENGQTGGVPINEEPGRAEDAIRASRSKGKASKTETNVPEPVKGKAGGKKTSPFDGWARIKPGSASSTATKPTRSRKRAASPSFEEQPANKA